MTINRTNYEEFFLMYVDNELPANERTAVEDFVEENPDLLPEFELITATVLPPADDITYENKNELFREEERRVVPFGWWRFAAAAAVLLGLTIMGWLFLADTSNETAAIVADSRPAVAEKNSSRHNSTGAAVVENSTSNTEASVNQKPAENSPAAKSSSANEAQTKPQAQLSRDREIVKESAARTPLSEPAPATTEPERHSQNTVVRRPDLVVDLPNAKASTTPPIDVEVPLEERDNALMAVNDEIVAQPQTTHYETTDNDDMIYFANTTVSKRNKLRGVFRKATRILDKVTSFQ